MVVEFGGAKFIDTLQMYPRFRPLGFIRCGRLSDVFPGQVAEGLSPGAVIGKHAYPQVSFVKHHCTLL